MFGDFLTRAKAATLYYAKAAIDALLAVVRSALGLDSGVYDLDAMPAAYAGGSGYHEKLQWIVDRMLLTDAGAATERDVVVLVGDQVYDISAAAFQETGTLGTYIHGTLYGACAQILVPNSGALGTHKLLTLTFRAKKPAGLSYSVVNGDGLNTHVLTSNAVIMSSATPPAGEGGNYAMIGVSRANDAYVNTHIAPVILRFEGVTFRASGGLTAVDGTHAFSVDGPHFKADSGVAAQDLHNFDPRRNADGTAYTGGAEIEFRKRQFALKTPMCWNGSRSALGLIEIQGYRYGMDWNEHVTAEHIFFNYCYTGIKLRGMSHTATLIHSKMQRCPIHFEAPEAGDWGGNATTAKLMVFQHGGEAYHPGDYGNPAGNRWYNHVSRIWDPSGLWLGEITLHESPGELSPTWQTLPSGHGANLYVRHQGTAPTDNDTIIDTHPDLETLVPVAGVLTITDHSSLVTDGRRQATITESTVLRPDAGLPHGAKGIIALKHSGAGHTLGGGTQTDYTVIAKDAPAAGVDDRVDFAEYECIWTSSPVKKILMLRFIEGAEVTGVTVESGGAIVIDGFGGTENESMHGRYPDTLGTQTWWDYVTNIWRIKSNKASVSNNGTSAWLIYDPTADGGSGTSAIEVQLTVDGTEGAIYAAIVNHNRGTVWTTWRWWAAEVNPAAGTIRLMYVPPGLAHEQRGSTYSFGGAIAAGTYTLRLDPSGGDTILIKWNGTTVVSYTVANRPGKGDASCGLSAGNSLSTATRWDDVKIYP